MKIFTEVEFYDFTNFAEISKVKHMLKKTEEGRKIMCGVEQKIFEEGQAKGILSTVKNMMKNLNLTAEKALDVCEVFGEKRDFCLAELEKTR